jgi:ParB family chromosome partitioning protein
VSASSDPLQIHYRDRASLKLYGGNARTHSDKQVGQIAASIRKFGWTNPILVDEQLNVVAGHGRLRAAAQLAMHEVPTITLPDLDEVQREALVIADNQIALRGGWDKQALAARLTELQGDELAGGELGFTEAELATLIGPPAGPGQEIEARYQILIDCDDDHHQARLLGEFLAEGLKCRALCG